MPTLELTEVEARLLKEAIIDARYELEEKVDLRILDLQYTKPKIEALKNILKKIEKTLAQN